MNFKVLQDKKTLKIYRWFVNSKPVTQELYELRQNQCIINNMRYNSSLTTSNEKDFIHTASYNK